MPSDMTSAFQMHMLKMRQGSWADLAKKLAESGREWAEVERIKEENVVKDKEKS